MITKACRLYERNLLRPKKKYLWFRFQTDPIFFCRPCYFFNPVDRATLFSPGGCGLLPKWRLLSHLFLKKPRKKYSKKKFISDLPTLIFSRYETGPEYLF
jgi:hypothetical protein